MLSLVPRPLFVGVQPVQPSSSLQPDQLENWTGHAVDTRKGGNAALTAASVRLRPILMTSLTLVASMAPLSIHLAPGGEAIIPLARAMIGGMVVSTVLTLFLVPCVYTIVKRGPTLAV